MLQPASRGVLQTAGKLHLFDALKQFLAGGAAEAGLREVGQQLGMSEAAVKVAVHRLRRRYRELLKEEIARTIVEPDTVEDELRESTGRARLGKIMNRRVTFSCFWVRKCIEPAEISIWLDRSPAERECV